MGGLVMDIGGVIFGALVIVGAIPVALAVRKAHGVERTVGIAGVIAVVGVGVVNLLKATGRLGDGPIYWTLNIAFVVLFSTTFFLLIRRKRSSA
jgi:hypothetical protein